MFLSLKLLILRLWYKFDVCIFYSVLSEITFHLSWYINLDWLRFPVLKLSFNLTGCYFISPTHLSLIDRDSLEPVESVTLFPTSDRSFYYVGC